MPCVRRDSEFMAKAIELDIHPDNLENIVYNFINIKGNEEKFPSNEEIRKALKPKTWIADESSFNAWMAFNFDGKPEVYGNLNAAMESYNRWKSMFPDSAVAMWRNNIGHYVVQVATPTMEGLPYAFDDTLIDSVMEDMGEGVHQNILKAIVDIIGKDNVKIGLENIDLSTTTMKGKEDKYKYVLAVARGNQVLFNPLSFREYLNNNFKSNAETARKKEIQRVLTHELVHTFTARVLRSHPDALTPEEFKFKSAIDDLYTKAMLKSKEFSEYYGFENSLEFIAEALSNPRFQAHLATIKSGKGTLWQQLVKIFNDLLSSLGVAINSDSILSHVLAATSEYMDYYKSTREKAEAERQLENEIFESEEHIASPDDLFNPSVIPAPKLRGQVFSKLSKLKDGLYSFEKREYLGNEYIAFVTPVNRETMDKAIEKGRQMLEKEGFDYEDFNFDTKTDNENRKDRSKRTRVMTVRIVPLTERMLRETVQKRQTLEEKIKKTPIENTAYEQLKEQEKKSYRYTSEDIAYLNQLEETNPSLYQEVFNGLLTIAEAREIDDGSIYSEPDNSKFDLNKDPEVILRKKGTWRELRGGEIVAKLPQIIRDKVVRGLQQYKDGKNTDHREHSETAATTFFDSTKDNTKTTSDVILDKIISVTKDKDLKKLAQIAKEKLGDKKIEITLKSNLDSRGKYSNSTGNIRIAQKAGSGVTAEEATESMARTIVHEIYHAITVDAITNNKELNKELAKIIGQFSDYLNQNNIDLGNLNVFKNEKEFIADFMSQPVLREVLKALPDKINGKPSNWFQRVMNFILKALGLSNNHTDYTKSLYDSAQKIINDVMNTQVAEWAKEVNDSVERESSNHEAEMQSIKEKAIADGTFMKAPNGKPTNLNERQWLQVRTEAFKNWFGDWERVAKNLLGKSNGTIDVNSIINEDGSINFDELEKITNEYFNSVAEEKFNKGRKTLRERKEHHPHEDNTLEHLQNVVKSANEINIRENLKPSLILAAALHDVAKPFHGGQKHGFQSVDVINSIFNNSVSNLVKFAVRHHMLTEVEGKEFNQEDANRIIQDAVDNEINSQDAIELLLAINTADIMSGMKPSDIDTYSGKTKKETIEEEIPAKRVLLANAINNIDNNASKVVDENGEPLVVYHGSESKEDFNVFNQALGNKKKHTTTNSYYFTDSEINANSYGKTRAFFLNIRNPHIYNFEGRHFKNKESYGISVQYLRDLSVIKDFDTIEEAQSYAEQLRKEYPEEASYFEVVTGLYERKVGKSTDEQLKDIQETNSNDGALFNNVEDRGFADVTASSTSEKIIANDYVVFNSNQIKSATDNNGDFATDDDVIYNEDDDSQVEIPKENPFNITNVEESKRQQFAKDTGITIDHIETPTKEDFNNYQFTEITLVTPEGARIQFAPKAGYQDTSKTISNISDIRATIGLNYLLEQYLMSHPEEVSKLGNSVLSDMAQELYEENYDVSKDNFKGDYASYIEFKRQNQKETITAESIPKLANKVSTEGKTEQYGVIVDTNLKQNQAKWHRDNPNGIVAYRVNWSTYNTRKEAWEGRIGNPFSENQRGQNTVKQFFTWLVTGENFGNEKATEEYRLAIIEKILNTSEGSPILYYTELNRPSHATVIGYLINNKELLAGIFSDIDKTILKNKGYINHSGGANGSDSMWGGIGATLGIKSNHYHAEGQKTPNGNTPLTAEQLAEADEHLKNANEKLGRRFPTSSEYTNNLLRRNWYQVKNADEIFAISTINNNTVNGGTGWAVQMAIDEGKPVHVFDQNEGKWYIWDGNRFVEEDTPILTKNFAGIGTREINEAGMKAIRDVYENTLRSLSNSTAMQSTKPTVTSTKEVTQKVNPNALTEETSDRIMEYKGDFEGASSILDSIVPNTLLTKVRDYILGEGELTESEAQDFLNYVEGAENIEDRTENSEDNPNTIKQENQEYHKKSMEVTKQIDNLYNSDYLTASEVRHVAEQVVYGISDLISEMQENPEQLFVYFPDKRTMEGEEWTEENKKKDIEKVQSFENRVDLVNWIGVQNILDYIQGRFEDSIGNLDDSTLYKVDDILDNWEAIITLAQDAFLNVENFSIVKSKTGNYETNSDITVNPDDISQHTDKMSTLENEGSEQEHWQIETKTLDIMSTMSQLVRQALQKCYLLDENGENIKSEFGINERVNVREAVNSILRWTQGALTMKDMIDRLNEKSKDTPWLTQLIKRLSDSSGAEADFQSQFFGTFAKHFQPYSVVIEENNTFKTIQVNEHPALTQALNDVIARYKVGECPLFTSEGINKSAFSTLKTEVESLAKYTGKEITDENIDDIANTIGYISNLFGYHVTPDIVKTGLNKESFKVMNNALNRIINAFNKHLEDNTYDPFKFDRKNNPDGIRGNMQEFLRPITEHLEDIAVSAFYDSGKMYQSYITPSYTTKLMQKFHNEDEAEFKEFIEKEYGQYEWFKDPKTGEWKNHWLEEMMKDKNARKAFAHKVQLNFNKHNYMKNLSDMEYALSLFTEYFSESLRDKDSTGMAWYRVPMLSNKPSSEFMRFYKEVGDTYEDTLTRRFKEVFDQELMRIQTITLRGKEKGDRGFIKNFDKNGKKFCFLDFMNKFLTGTEKNSELGKLIRYKIAGKEVDEEALNTLAKKEIKDAMNERASRIVAQWDKQGIVKAAMNIQGAGKTEAEVRENLKNFVWNDTYASMMIMQLTITDIAYYKDAEDLQKRLAQIHAPGIRGRIDATDYEGNLVTDGTFRTILIKDFDDFISNVIDNVNIVFERKIERAKTEKEKNALRALQESLTREEIKDKNGNVIQEAGAFRKINVADAQGYSCPSSYRKKAFIFGKWSRKAEEVYQNLKNGTYTYSDLKIAFQPLKPFVYSQTTLNADAEGAPMSKLKTPVQFKNSEYLLIMADALLRSEDTGNPNILRALYDIMEKSHYEKDGKTYKTNGIDTIQFESTTKSGLMTPISLKEFLKDPLGEDLAKARIESLLYNEDGMTYNKQTVYEVPFEDYCLQQEVPEHFKGHDQAHGSQLRYIAVSELDATDAYGAPMEYTIKDPKTGDRTVSAKEFKEEYERTIAENIEQSFEELARDLSLDSFSIKDRNISLSKVLQREILSSPRYGIDLLMACSVDENGQFRIPLGDPIQSKRVEQLINSIVKNRINKQKIAGGPVVQVTNFGTSKQLNIRFKDKNGNLLMTRDEYEKRNRTQSYEDYIKENQGGLAYLEVFAPIYANEIFEKFQNEDGTIDIEAIEATDPDLLKMIGYRIPTEDKYSMAPLKIVGFLPREAGDGIMLPYEITLLTGSDFDVDKEYLMRKEYNKITERGEKELVYKVYKERALALEQSGVKLTYEERQQLHEEVEKFVHEMKNGRTDFNTPEEKLMAKSYKKNKYKVTYPKNGRAYRNNKIVDMTYEVLTHETSVDKILNPGGFDPQKKMGYLVEAYKLVGDETKEGFRWEDMEKMSIDELKDFTTADKNLSFIDTHIQFYKQNAAAGSLIGIFAVNRIAHAVIESGSPDGAAMYQVDVNEVCNINHTFTVAGMTFGGLMPFDQRYDRNGQLIGKSMGSLVAASVDAVKDPVLNLMNINSQTAGILNTLVRMGMPFEDAALFLSQDVISKVLEEFSRANITKFTKPMSVIISEVMATYRQDHNLSEDSQLNTEELTKEDLIKGIKNDTDGKIGFKTLIALKNFMKLADFMKMTTFATRFNSMSSAVGPLIIDNLIAKRNFEKYSATRGMYKLNESNGKWEQVFMKDIFDSHPILKQFHRTFETADDLMGRNMPANSIGFEKVLNLVKDTPLEDAFYGDKKTLSSLSDFYQSYLVMRSGVVDMSRLGDVITNFPVEFMKNEYKKKYPDNLLIQAIRYDTTKNGRLILKVDTTGLDAQQKEKLSNAWIDLHKTDAELSKKLFEYNFFRGGIGFNPKTFMALMPVYVKERIEGYVDTFRKFPSVVPEIVLDQFIRNNWNNDKLVPYKKVKNFSLLNNGNWATDDISLENVLYFKRKVDGQDKMYHQVLSTEGKLEYEEITPLGSNKEYLEISEESVKKAMEIPLKAEAEESPSELPETSNAQFDTTTEANFPTDNTTIWNMVMKVYTVEGVRTEDEVPRFVRTMRDVWAHSSESNKQSLEKGQKKFIRERLTQEGIEFNERQVDEVFKTIC